eukprot:3876621-Lingulodinium_polyedra.AAC.1
MHIGSAVEPLKVFCLREQLLGRVVQSALERAFVRARVRACARAFARVWAAASAARGSRARANAQ